MKILIDTPDRLVIESRPILLSLALVAMILVLLYAAFSAYSAEEIGKAFFILVITIVLMGPSLWFAVERVQVVFDRRAQTCSLHKRRMSGDERQTHPLSDVTRAMIQTRKGDHDNADTHRIALVLGADRLEKRHGLTQSYRSGPQAEKVVQRINAWLDSARPKA
ncbi:hypothetical protein [uncultured Roseobacter sp.]|uniref:hypothetical protein n=1 Tax=uncultured Roseobacter sp. TaxID=114847 RepID=UPI00262C9BF2|nr:hypothetical protein [uncultured Roseobacter sp.]